MWPCLSYISVWSRFLENRSQNSMYMTFFIRRFFKGIRIVIFINFCQCSCINNKLTFLDSFSGTWKALHVNGILFRIHSCFYVIRNVLKLNNLKLLLTISGSVQSLSSSGSVWLWRQKNFQDRVTSASEKNLSEIMFISHNCVWNKVRNFMNSSLLRNEVQFLVHL